MKKLISAQTSAATHKIAIGANRRVTISAGKLANAEAVTFQLDEEDVSSIGDLYQDGSIRQLTATHNSMTIEGPIDLQVSKSVTALAVGVYLKG